MGQNDIYIYFLVYFYLICKKNLPHWVSLVTMVYGCFVWVVLFFWFHRKTSAVLLKLVSQTTTVSHFLTTQYNSSANSYSHIIQGLCFCIKPVIQNNSFIILYCWCCEELCSFVKQKKEMKKEQKHGILKSIMRCFEFWWRGKWTENVNKVSRILHRRLDWFIGFLCCGSDLRLKVFDVIWSNDSKC